MVRTLQILCISTTCFGLLLAIIRKVYSTDKRKIISGESYSLQKLDTMVILKLLLKE
jgi:hypothetical protein